MMKSNYTKFLSAVLVFAAIAAMSVMAQKRGKTPTLWQEEHSGVPYVNQDVHYVLPDQVIDANGVTHSTNPDRVGQARPAVVIRVYIDRNPDTGMSQDIDAKINLAPGDTTDNLDDLWLSRVPASGPRQLGFWSHLPDPRDFKVLGQ